MSLSSLALPFLRLMDPEQAHQATLLALKAGLGSCGKKDPEALGIDLLGMHFPNPLGIAAGFDKNGEVPDAMLKLGFGFAEVGTTTPRPQSGNPKPRIFRLSKTVRSSTVSALTMKAMKQWKRGSKNARGAAALSASIWGQTRTQKIKQPTM